MANADNIKHISNIPKLCQASSQQLSKWPHNVQQGEKTGLGSGWGEEGPNFQSTSHLAFFLGPFSFQNIEESQNIYPEFTLQIQSFL